MLEYCFFFFNDTATTEIYTLSLHDALPICQMTTSTTSIDIMVCKLLMLICILTKNVITSCSVTMMLFLHLRSEERFSRNAETDLVCRLLLEKKKIMKVHAYVAVRIMLSSPT